MITFVLCTSFNFNKRTTCTVKLEITAPWEVSSLLMFFTQHSFHPVLQNVSQSQVRNREITAYFK